MPEAVELTAVNGRMVMQGGDKGTPDLINSPPHYRTGKIEVIDFIEDQKLSYHLGNCVKYICRAPHKGTEEQDIDKALWYLKRYISLQGATTRAEG